MSRRGHAWSRSSDRPTTPGWDQQRLHHTAGRPGPRRQRTVTHDQARSRHLRDVWHRARAPSGLIFQVCCPGVVATEFHTRQGMDLSAVPRMSAHDVVSRQPPRPRAWRGRLRPRRRGHQPARRRARRRPGRLRRAEPTTRLSLQANLMSPAGLAFSDVREQAGHRDRRELPRSGGRSDAARAHQRALAWRVRPRRPGWSTRRGPRRR